MFCRYAYVRKQQLTQPWDIIVEIYKVVGNYCRQ